MRQCGFVGAETDLFALMLCIGSVVRDTLGIMGVAGAGTSGFGVGEAAGECRIERILDVDDMETATARFTA